MVVAMPDEYIDPAGNTQAFRAYVEAPEPVEPRSKLPQIIGLAVAAVVLVALVIWLAVA